MSKTLVLSSILALTVASFSWAAAAKEFVPGEPAFTPDPAVPAFEPTAVTPDFIAPESFTIPDGLEITVWATSPMLFNPANMDVDAKGRIWIAEGINYRRHSGRSREGDCIRVLEDTDGDGKADSSHVFVREPGLECPLGVAVFDNVIVVSNTPDLIVYTDVDRDLKFDSQVDTREVLLTGFEKPQHDHSLHSVHAGPDGRWYFTNGNCGAKFTDRSGKTFRIGSSYMNNTYTGEASDDGHVYVGGFAASVNPDGTAARILGFNNRNSFESVITSLGDHFQNDNDDPPACRVSNIIEGGSFGFFSRDGLRTWRADKRPGQSIPEAEWRQDDPGSIPAGDVYGGGAPTGMAFYENGALGKDWEGLLLSCETGRNTVFGYKPARSGAGFELNRTDFCTTNTTGEFKGSDFVGGNNNLAVEKHAFFRPSDVCVGPDGAIYISDWFDPRTGGHTDLDETCSGAIYRIAPKGFKSKVPALDLSTTEGQLTALQSPAINTRHVGFTRLAEKGASVIDQVAALLGHENPFIAARAVWLLTQLGPKGIQTVRAQLDSPDAAKRLVALRALRSVSQAGVAMLARLAADKDPSVRREVAVALRDVPAADSLDILVELARHYDGQDRAYLEAWGIGCTGKETAVWTALSKTLGNADPLKWSPAFARLTWRLHTADAVPGAQKRALAADLPAPERKLAMDTLAFVPEASAAQAMLAVAKDKESPLHGDAIWWLIMRSNNDWSEFGVSEQLKEQGIFDPDAAELIAVVTPPSPPADQGPQLEDVLAHKGDAANGAQVVARCYMCHQLNGQGVEFGPSLEGWGKTQPSSVIAEALINPSKDIAHGFEGEEIIIKGKPIKGKGFEDGVTIHGMVLMDGPVLMVRSLGGQTQFISKKRIKSRKKLATSLMMSAAQLGMTAQDVADAVAYLRSADAK